MEEVEVEEKMQDKEPVKVSDEIQQDPQEDANLKRAQRRGRRSSVSAECGLETEAANYQKIVIPKSAEEIARIRQAIGDNFLFCSLDEDQQQAIFDAMAEKHFSDGDEIIKQGDEGDYFYVLDSGTCEVYVNGESVLTYNKGSSFGELALMYNTPRAATVAATSDCVTWAVDRGTFRSILCNNKSSKRKKYEEFLANYSMFKQMNEEELHRVADVLEEYIFSPGERIVLQGDDSYEKMKFYMIQDGVAEAFQVPLPANESKDADESKMDLDREDIGTLVGVMERGDFFGEKALIEQQPRAATVVAKTRLVVAALDVAGFERLMGPFKEIMKRQIKQYECAQ